MKLLDIWYDKA